MNRTIGSHVLSHVLSDLFRVCDSGSEKVARPPWYNRLSTESVGRAGIYVRELRPYLTSWRAYKISREPLAGTGDAVLLVHRRSTLHVVDEFKRLTLHLLRFQSFYETVNLRDCLLMISEVKWRTQIDVK